MSGKIIMNLAMSLDGYIADTDGGYGWIEGHSNSDLDTENKYDYQKFLEGIDIVVMGRKCYQQGMNLDFPDKKVFVATNEQKEDEGNTCFIRGDIVGRILEEKSKGMRIFLFGGGVLVDNFLKQKAVDEYIVGIVPTILGRGIKLFHEGTEKTNLFLQEYVISDGIAIVKYSRRK